MPDHVNITDPNIHEPKGVSTATAGDVYVADGAGSGAWGPVGLEFASVYTRESDGVSVSTIGTTAQTLPFSNDGPDNSLTSDSSNNRITLATAGTYLVSFHISFETAAAGDAGTYEFKIQDDAVDTYIECASEMSGGGDTSTVSTQGILTVAAGSQLTVTVESDEAGNTDDINIYNAVLNAVLLEAS